MKKKENKEIANAQMAQLVPTWRDLVFADTQLKAEKTKRAISCLRTTER